MNANNTFKIEPHIFEEAIKNKEMFAFVGKTSKGHNSEMNINDSMQSVEMKETFKKQRKGWNSGNL